MRGMACSARVDFLRPVLERFVDNLHQYAEVTGWEDLAHYYNERATLSLFAAACWQSNFIAVEEFVTWKGRGSAGFSGRTDLWACCPTTGMDIAIEAKQQWPGLGVRSSAVRSWLEKTDAAACQNYGAALRAGLTFLVPSLPSRTTRDAVVSLFDHLHKEALAYGADALAWWLPEEAMRHRSLARSSGEECIWPGLLAMLRVVKVRGGGVIPTKERLRETGWTMTPVPV